MAESNGRTRPNIGEKVVYHDELGNPHDALVTAIYSDTCINAVFVSSDESRTDSYGRQIERTATCNHKSQNPTHGRYYRFDTEAPNPVAVPEK